MSERNQDGDDASRQVRLSPDRIRLVGAEIEITKKMIEAGVRALHDCIGYQYNGDAVQIVSSIFAAMRKSSIR